MSDDVVTTDNPGRSRFEARIGDEVLGIAEYDLQDATITFVHTEVKDEAEGKGVGSALARTALDSARDAGLDVVVKCEFIAGWIDKHPDYADLVS